MARDPPAGNVPGPGTTAPPQRLVRIDLPCMIAGFSPPPCSVHLKYVQVRDRWHLHGLTAPGRPTAIARWLEAYHPVSVRVGGGIAPRFIRAEFDKLPPKWNDFLTRLRVRYVELTAAGTASIFVEGSNETVEHTVDALELDPESVHTRRATTAAEPTDLTPRQLEVLSTAVALGYYELPHRLHLRALAQKLGLSVGAVSELLRRGEAGIINRYIDSLAHRVWNEPGSAEPAELRDATPPR